MSNTPFQNQVDAITDYYGNCIEDHILYIYKNDLITLLKNNINNNAFIDEYKYSLQRVIHKFDKIKEINTLPICQIYSGTFSVSICGEPVRFNISEIIDNCIIFTYHFESRAGYESESSDELLDILKEIVYAKGKCTE